MNLDLMVKKKMSSLLPLLAERQRRSAVAAEARFLGYGGISLVSRVTGISRKTIHRGVRELDAAVALPLGRNRRAGGGRKKLLEKDPSIVKALKALADSTSRGDPMSPLRWTCKSTRQLASALIKQKYDVSAGTVGTMLKELGYSLQGNRKTKEGTKHPDRNAQFEYINQQVIKQQTAGQPVISVDTKKKELVGDFKNAGREWHPQGQPERVRVHDFVLPKKGKAIPYGVFDPVQNSGWVSIGIDHDTASFAVNAIRQWWRKMGRGRYPRAKTLMITADSGGSNSARSRLWKLELQKLASETGLFLAICHFPPGTSKWNKIEHRLFSFITRNWRGKPLRSLATIVNLIANTRTSSGLTVRCHVDKNRYPLGVKVSEDAMAKINLRNHKFHGEWNYTISPIQTRKHG